MTEIVQVPSGATGGGAIRFLSPAPSLMLAFRFLRMLGSPLSSNCITIITRPSASSTRSLWPHGHAAAVFIREAERPERQRCGDSGRLFGERGREHKAENLEAARACGV